jgi:ABC-type branched-subunit amino acid transport system permease subunit
MTGVALVLGFFLVVPMFAGTKLVYWSGSISTFVLLMSLGLLVRTSGQISLCHVGLAAVGAAAFSRLAAEHHVPWLVAVLVAGLATTVVGLIIAIPAVRLSGLYLALATFGFGILLAQMFYTRAFFFGQSDGIPMPRPDFWRFSSDRGYYYAELVVACGCALLVVVIERSRLGRLLRGLADSPIALTTLGANANVTRIIAFSVSAFLAGVSGALLGAQFQTIDQNSFAVFSSLILVAVLAISGRSTIRAAVIGSLLFTVMPGYVNHAEFNQWLPLIFGSAALVAAVGSQGWNLPERLARAAAGSSWRIAGPTRPGVPTPARAAHSSPSARPADDHGSRRRDRVGSTR